MSLFHSGTKIVKGGLDEDVDKQKASPDINRSPDRHSAVGFVIQNTNKASQLTPRDKRWDVGQRQTMARERRFTLEI